MVRVQRLVLVHAGSADATNGARCYPTAAAGGACALCDVAWAGRTQKPPWWRLQHRLGVPFERAYRNTATQAVLAVCSSYPSIVARTERSHELLLDSTGLEACSGSVQSLLDELRRSARARGLGFL